MGSNAWGSPPSITFSVDTNINSTEIDGTETITISVSSSAIITIYINGITEKSCNWKTSCSVNYKPYNNKGNYLYVHEVSAQAWNFNGVDYETRTINYFSNFAYKHGSTTLYNFFWYTIAPLVTFWRDTFWTEIGDHITGPVNTEAEKIYAIHYYAKRLLTPKYNGGSDVEQDNDGKSAIQVHTFWNNPNRNFDCRDLSMYITGIADAIGLSARLISSYNYHTPIAHIFAEIYGVITNGNNGWFRIDPSLGVYQSSETDIDDAADTILGPGSYRMYGSLKIVDGWTHYWGRSGLPSFQPAAGWTASPPTGIGYNPNPWSLHGSDV